MHYYNWMVPRRLKAFDLLKIKDLHIESVHYMYMDQSLVVHKSLLLAKMIVSFFFMFYEYISKWFPTDSKEYKFSKNNAFISSLTVCEK